MLTTRELRRLADSTPKRKRELDPDLLEQLNAHFEGTGGYLSPPTFLKLVHLKKKFPEILEVPSTCKYVYRLMVDLKPEVAAAIGCKGDAGILKGGQYTPKFNPSSSWTADLSLYARPGNLDFLDYRGEIGKYMVLLEAPVDHSKFLGYPGKLAKYCKLPQYAGQKEVIGHGTLPIRRMAYVRIRDHRHPYEKTLMRFLQTGKVELPFTTPQTAIKDGDNVDVLLNGSRIAHGSVDNSPSKGGTRSYVRLLLSDTSKKKPLDVLVKQLKDLVKENPADYGRDELEWSFVRGPQVFAIQRGKQVVPLEPYSYSIVSHVGEWEHYLTGYVAYKKTRPKSPSIHVAAPKLV